MNNQAQMTLGLSLGRAPNPPPAASTLPEELLRFDEFGKRTVELKHDVVGRGHIPVFVNEFWTAKQRQANSLHEISYRACFKPQLPRFFIERLTRPRDVVYDPFMGRGTTLLEAALLDRVPYGSDINPLSITMIRPRLRPPSLRDVEARLAMIDLGTPHEAPNELLVFFHPDTLREIAALRAYLLQRKTSGKMDAVDEWISLVAVNRLTGHSSGFFSVYTLPPNQATSVKAQARINERRKQVPPKRDIKRIILKKSRILLGESTPQLRSQLDSIFPNVRLFTGPAAETPGIPDESVALIVTSPPFLDIVNYATDNWLRCWFLGIDSQNVKLTVPGKLEVWQSAMADVFKELFRVTKKGGHVAFEVGEVRCGTMMLEEAVVPCGVEAGFKPLLVLINDQEFTKTANCWGVKNMEKGTNTNRIVVFRK